MKTNSVTESNVDRTTELATEKTSASFWATARTNLRLRYQSPPIEPAVRQSTIPLSFNQERLWNLEQIQPGSSVYNLLHSFRLVGYINLEALEQSLQAMAKRHEILRTSFHVVDNEPVQAIAPDINIELSAIDLQGLSPDRQAVEVQRYAIQQAEQLFDLTQAPLWRVQLLRLSAEEHILLRTAHHLIFDAWSHGVFVRELGSLYDAFVTGNLSPLKDLPIQYADFAYFQRNWFQGDTLASRLEYWQGQFSGDVAALELPIDRPRSATTSYQGAYQSRQFSPALTEALKALSYQQGTSLFVTLLAAFKTLLYGYSGQEDLVVCSPVDGRHRLETKGSIGYFNNVVALRTDLSGNPSFRELVNRVGQVFVGAYEHQDTPLQLVAELPNLVRTPLTRAMFILQNTPNPPLELAGLTVSSVYMDREIANFDLTLSMQEKDGQLTAILQYKTDLFESATIEVMLENFQNLLESLVANPDRSLSDLPRFASLADSEINQQSQLSQSVRAESFVAPRSDLERQLAKIWEQLFGIHPIGVKDNFFELGGHSLLAVRLFAQIEQSLGVNVPLAILLQAPTIEQLAQTLDRANWHESWSSLVPLQPKGNRPPLFCIHGGGVNILIYRDLADRLGEEQPVYALQARGLDGRTKPHTTVEEMAAAYIEHIRTVRPEGPYFLAGLSHGGVVALEMAQQLRSQGQDVAFLAMLDTYGPNLREFLPPISRLFAVISYLIRYSLPRYVKRNFSGESKLSFRQIAKRFRNRKRVNNPLEVQKMPQQDSTQKSEDPPWIDEFNLIPNDTNRIEAWIHKLNMFVLEHSPLAEAYMPSHSLIDIDGTQSQVVKELEVVHSQASRKYVPRPYQGCITLFRASEQPVGFRLDPNYGWGEIPAGGLEIYDIPGHHTSIAQSPVLARKVKACIDRILELKG